MNLLMPPICGQLMLLHEDGLTDRVLTCWKEPGHDAFHEMTWPPGQGEVGELLEKLEQIRVRVEEYRGEVDWCVICTGHEHLDSCPFYNEEDRELDE